MTIDDLQIEGSNGANGSKSNHKKARDSMALEDAQISEIGVESVDEPHAEPQSGHSARDSMAIDDDGIDTMDNAMDNVRDSEDDEMTSTPARKSKTRESRESRQMDDEFEYPDDLDDEEDELLAPKQGIILIFWSTNDTAYFSIGI